MVVCGYKSPLLPHSTSLKILLSRLEFLTTHPEVAKDWKFQRERQK